MTEVSVLSAARAQILRDDDRQLREDDRSQRVDERSEDDRSQRIAQRLETEQTEQFQREAPRMMRLLRQAQGEGRERLRENRRARERYRRGPP